MPAEAPDPPLPVSPVPSFQSEALLTELECWRDLLARDIIEKHPAVTEPDLNYTILRTILQLLFVKIVEERGLVGHGMLQRLSLTDQIHGRLCGQAADERIGFLTGIFQEDGNGRPLSLAGDEVMRTITGRMESFEFPSPLSTIPLPELAGVFEQYLGSKMRLAEGYRVQRDHTSMIRDAGGVHIPPQPVVNYIARGTVEHLAEGKTPREVSQIRILDPACGSGIFLLSVYRHLLDWHLTWYRTYLVSVLASKEHIGANGIHTLASGLPAYEGDRGSKEPDLPVRYGGDGDPSNPDSWRLSPSEKQRILTTLVFGSDIEPEPVHIARFLLLLAALDEYTPPVVDQPDPSWLCMTAERLRDTIRCGNTLIGPDYFTHKQEHPFNVRERQRVNAFDWQEAFPEILLGGGFDAIIGAPPAHRPFSMKSRDEYFQMHYTVYAKTSGLYGYFIERGLSLLKGGGVLSFIVPDTFLRAHHARPLRRLLLGHQIEEIVDIDETRILQTIPMRMCILRITKRGPEYAFLVSRIQSYGSPAADECLITHRFAVDQRSLDDGGWTLEDRRVESLIKKIRGAGAPLEDYVMGQIEQGTVHIRNNRFVIDASARNRFIKKEWHCKKLFRPLLRPSDIQRYHSKKPDRFLITAKNSRELKRCRVVWTYVQFASFPSGSGGERKGGAPSGREPESGGPEHSRPFVVPVPVPRIPKIIYAPVQEHPVFSYDADGSFAITSSLFAIPRTDPVLAAILNSTLGRFIITHTCPHGERGYQLAPEHIGKFPICTPDFDNASDAARHDRIVALVTQISALHKQLSVAGKDQERRLVQQEIDATDVKIDALVYELYGLTAEEIQVIVESH
jgi:hypothetical protein